MTNRNCIFCKIISGESPLKSGWKPMHSKVNKFFKKCEGYISFHNYEKADDHKLAKIATMIREAKA